MNTGSVLAQFTITLSKAVIEPVQVEWFTSEGTAKAGVDFAANKGVAVFAAGETEKKVDILVYGRAVGAEDRSFFVEMLPPTNAILGAAIGECIIHVDTSGSVPVTQIIVPTGPQGLTGKSAYQSYLDTTTDNPPKTEAEWVDSLKGDPAEIAQEVASLIDVGSTTLTAEGTEALSKPDATTVKAVARRVAYAAAAKIATVVLSDGDNTVGQSDMTGDTLDMSSEGLYPRIMRGSSVITPQWSIQPDGKITIKAAVAGDVLYVCQYDFVSSRKINTNTRELWRRTCAEAGLTLVDGSFEEGATANSKTDAVWYIAGGQCYTWDGALPKTVAAGSTPETTGGVGLGVWVSVGKAAKWRDEGDIRGWGGVANGVTDDTTAISAAKSDVPVLHIPVQSNVTTDAYPTVPVSGNGKITVQGVEINNFSFRFDPVYTNLVINPTVFGEKATGNYFGRPTDTEPDVFDNVIVSPGFPGLPVIDGATVDHDFYSNSIFGHGIGEKLQWARYTDAYGADTLKFAAFAERCTIIGTLGMPWLGQDLTTDTSRNPAYPDVQRYYENDILNDNGLLWTNPAWDAFELKTHSPGVVDRISAWVASNPWPASRTASTPLQRARSCGYNVAVGRDALNQKIDGSYNTAVGYRAAALNMAGDYNTAFGYNAGFSNLYDTGNTSVGTFAFQHQQEGGYNTSMGYRAGNGIIKGSFNVCLGASAGAVGADYDATVDVEVNRSVFIGQGAGSGLVDPVINDKLIVQDGTTRGPLIAGDFANYKIAFGKLPVSSSVFSHQGSATAVVFSGDSGVDTTNIALSGDDIVIHQNNNAGLTIATPGANTGGVYFARPGSSAAGSVVYDHNTDTMILRANNVSRWKITGSALAPTSDNVISFGTAIFRPSQLYAGNGSISTSDATKKTEPRSISNSEISAFSAILRLPGVWQWLDRVESEGEDARLHAGPTVQAAIAIMQANGLDWTRYAAFCYDEWGDKFEPVYATRIVTSEVTNEDSTVTLTQNTEEYNTGELVKVVEAGSLYSFRKEELLWWCLRSVVSQFDSIEARVSELEKTKQP